VALIHLLSLLTGALYLVRVNRDQWFYGDEWAFLGGARRHLPWYDQLLAPHNEHWSTAPYLVYRVLEAIVGIRSYWPYFLTAIVLHLVVVHLVWWVMLQSGSDPFVATVVVLPLIVLGAGAQDLLWAFQMGFLGSLALGLGALLLVNHVGGWRRRDWAALAVILFALLWSGVAVLMVGLCVLVVLLRRGWRQAAALAVAPAAVYLVWTFAYPPPDALAATSVRELGDLLGPYVATGLSTAADAFVFNLPLLGSLCLVVLGVYLVRTAERATTEAAVVYACALGAAAQFALSAYARAKLGTEQATETRYGYIVVILLAPAVAMVVSRFVRGRGEVAFLALTAVFVVLGVTNAHLLRVHASDDEGRERKLRGLIVSAARIAADPRETIARGAVPEPRYSPDLTVADLRRFARNGELPHDITPLEGQLTAAANLQVGLDPTAPLASCSTAAGRVLQTGAHGVRAVVHGTPLSVIAVTLVDRATGVRSETRQLTLPALWSLLSIYAKRIDAEVATPADVHLCER
jgi:hypothetical protein